MQSFVRSPLGPEDVISYPLRGLSLQQMATPTLPITANYSPARRHPRPVKRTYHNMPLESGQFADVDK